MSVLNDIFLSMLAIFLMSFPAGYLAWRALPKHRSISFMELFPILLTIGMAVMILGGFLFSILGIFNIMSILIFIALLWIMTGYQLSRERRLKKAILSRTRYVLESPSSISDSLNKAKEQVNFGVTTNHIILFVVFLSFLVYFGYLTILLQWSPAGDPLTTGLISSLLIDSGRFPVTYAPLSDFNLTYPTGFSILSSEVALISQIPIGFSGLALASFTSALMIASIISIIFYLTKSLQLSLLGIPLIFMMPAGSFAESLNFASFWLSPYVFGSYASWLGNGIVIALIAITSIEVDSRKKLLITGLLCIALVLAYYPYAVYYLFSAVFYYLAKLRLKSRMRAIFLFSVIAAFIAITASYSQISSLLINNEDNYALLHSEFTTILGIKILVATPLAAFQVYRFKSYTGILYLVLAVPAILSLNESLYEGFLYPFLSRRYAVLLSMLAIIVILLSLKSSLDYLRAKRTTLSIAYSDRTGTERTRSRSLDMVLRLSLVAIITLGMIPSIYQTVSYKDFTPSINSSDKNAMLWMSSNIDKNELVLNDRSFGGLFITSFKLMNVTNAVLYGLNRDSENEFIKRAQVLNTFYDNPAATDFFKKKFEEYGVDYIFVSSDPIFFDYYGTVYQYHYRSFTSQQLREILITHYEYEEVYSSGDSLVFKVK